MNRSQPIPVMQSSSAAAKIVPGVPQESAATASQPEGADYFGLAESPFKLISSSRFLFESASYLAAVKGIAYALSCREPLIIVTGPIGTRKTTLCRLIAERAG